MKVYLNEHEITDLCTDLPSLKITTGIESGKKNIPISISIINKYNMFSEFNNKSIFYHNYISDFTLTIKYNDDIIFSAPVINIDEEGNIATIHAQNKNALLETDIESLLNVSIDQLLNKLVCVGFKLSLESILRLHAVYDKCTFSLIQSSDKDNTIKYEDIFNQLIERIGLNLFYGDQIILFSPYNNSAEKSEYMVDIPKNDIFIIELADSRDMILNDYEIEIFGDDIIVRDTTDGISISALSKERYGTKMWNVSAKENGIVFMDRATAQIIGDYKLRRFKEPFPIITIELPIKYAFLQIGDIIKYDDSRYQIMEIEYLRLTIKLTMWAI